VPVPAILPAIGYAASILGWGMTALDIALTLDAVTGTIADLNENETAAFKRFICEYAEDIEIAQEEINSALEQAVNNAHWLAFEVTGETAYQKPEPSDRDIRSCESGDQRACRRVRDAQAAASQYDRLNQSLSEKFNYDIRENVLRALQSRTTGEAIPSLAIRAIDFNMGLAGGDETASAFWTYDETSTRRASREIFVDTIVYRLLSRAESDPCPDKVKAAYAVAIELFKTEIEDSARTISSDPAWLDSLAFSALVGNPILPSDIEAAQSEELAYLRAELNAGRQPTGPRYSFITREHVQNSTDIELIGSDSSGNGVVNILQSYLSFNPEALETEGFWNQLDDLGAVLYNNFNSVLDQFMGFSFPLEEDSCGRFCGINYYSGEDWSQHSSKTVRMLACNIEINSECLSEIIAAANRAIDSGYYDDASEFASQRMVPVRDQNSDLRDYGESIGIPRSAMDDGHYDAALQHVRSRFRSRERDDGVSLPECFVPSTNISMWDGTFKEIKDVKIGDEVLSMTKDLNPVMGIVTYVLITKIGRSIPVAKLGDLTCSTTHPIFYNGEWAEIKDSTAPVEIVDEYVEEYWNLEIDAHDIHGSDHNFIADGYLMSGLGNNITLNAEYQRQPKWNDENRESFLERRLKIGPLQSSEEQMHI